MKRWKVNKEASQRWNKQKGWSQQEKRRDGIALDDKAYNTIIDDSNHTAEREQFK